MKNYHHLTQEQRYQIAACLQMGNSQGRIAVKLGVDKSTISRELKRNADGGVYGPNRAHERAAIERLRCRKPFILIDPLLSIVLELLKQYWSPEQISGWLKKENKGSVSHECIYQYLQRDRDTGGNLYKYLRHSQRRRRKRFAKERRGKIVGRISIEQRPEHISKRTEIGHWERDTIIGENHKAGLAVHVEKKTYFVRICRLIRKTAENFSQITSTVMKGVSIPCNSITNDNGLEFANHQTTTKELGAAIYFSHPYTSCDCALVENTNGLIRQFFPKKCNFSNYTDQEIEQAENLLNSRPRKKLGFLTPCEAVAQELN